MSMMSREHPLPMDQDWRTDAACRGQDPSLFFPTGADRDAAKAALAFCAVCPVSSDCLADALADYAHDDFGIRGGMTQRQRRNLPHRTAPGVVDPCGSNAGYYRHYRAGQTACDPCREAHNEHRRTRKAGVAQPSPKSWHCAWGTEGCRRGQPCSDECRTVPEAPPSPPTPTSEETRA